MALVRIATFLISLFCITSHPSNLSILTKSDRNKDKTINILPQKYSIYQHISLSLVSTDNFDAVVSLTYVPLGPWN